MSLSEKYEQSVQMDREKKEADRLASEKEAFFRNHRFMEGRCNLRRIELTDAQKALIKEAVELLKDVRWNRIKDYFNEDDAMEKVLGRELITRLEGDEKPHYVQMKWKDKTICCGAVAPAVIRTEGRFLRLNRRRAKKAIPELVRTVNVQRTELKTLYEEDQEYVLLHYDAGRRTEGCDYVLFKDGHLFPAEESHNAVIDDFFIYRSRGSADRKPLEDWLIENIKRIKGEPAEQPAK